ncbi:VOC family protein [Emcibacter sp.]|uniref:VOC family protein n=1 Tax=Emcibacter sp. TaxID=1979954 RepID=UPI002AA8C57E|nr:VOC family protein [Emcibacter sp.]
MTALYSPVMQIAYVVEDIEKAARHWALTLGVGPFYLLDHIPFKEIFYRDEPSPIDISVAIAYSGEIQIELIQQHNDAPSIYTEFKQKFGYGQQHLGVTTERFQDALDHFAERGIKPRQQGKTLPGMNFAYLETDFHPGGMLELIEADESIMAAFDMIQKSSKNWDGDTVLKNF